MNPVEATLRDLPIILDDLYTEAVGIRAKQRDALAALCAAVRGDGFYEHLLARCDEASDPVVGRPSPDEINAAGRRAWERSQETGQP